MWNIWLCNIYILVSSRDVICMYVFNSYVIYLVCVQYVVNSLQLALQLVNVNVLCLFFYIF